MRGFVWVSLATAALLGACVVVIDDVESKQAQNGTGGSSGSDASVGGSPTGGSAGASAGGAPTGGSSGNGGSEIGGSGGSVTGGNGGTAATGGAVSGGGTGGVNPCPGGMVHVPGTSVDYCIDSTEVTQAEYQKFLNGTAPVQTDPCSSNSLEPTCDEFDAATYPKRPAVCVDWCDARAFCTAVGKRLCGKVGGGTADPGAITSPDLNEWFRACSAGGLQKFPYGNLYAPKCNDINAPTTTPVDVGLYGDCIGGYPGLYDMSGNVREWEATCNVNGCYARGGAYTDLQDNVACPAAILTTRTAATKDLGFRCCSD